MSKVAIHDHCSGGGRQDSQAGCTFRARHTGLRSGGRRHRIPRYGLLCNAFLARWFYVCELTLPSPFKSPALDTDRQVCVLHVYESLRILSGRLPESEGPEATLEM